MAGREQLTSEVLRRHLKEERVRQRRTQSELSSLVGRTRKWLSEYERGKVDASAGTVFALAACLGVEIFLAAPSSRLDGGS